MMPGYASKNQKAHDFRLSVGKSPDAKSIKASESPEQSVKGSVKDV